MVKVNIVHVHKKSNKQNIKNYRPVYLLPIYGKIFERLIFNEIFFHASTNYYQLPTKFINHLMTD